ncbi:MAG: extracellular solute-binding protein [Clostridia bacterium]|nr:extracellular solute-binding protein [Clostridia bacterium]
MLKKILIIVTVFCLCVCGLSIAEGEKPYEGVTLTLLEQDNAVLPFDLESESLKAIQKETGITLDIQLVADTDWNTKVSTLLAANNIPDITRVNFNLVNQYAKDGMFVNLTEAMEEGKLPNYSSAVERAGDVMKYYKVGGEQYSFQLIWEIGLPNGAVPYIRGDVLDELNLEVPTSFDELYTTLKAIKEYDPDNYPWVTRWASLQIDYSYGVGGLCYYDHKLGQYVSGYTDVEKYTNYLEYAHKLYSEGLVDPDFLTTTSADWQEACKNGTCYFTFNNCVFVNQFNMALQQDQPEAYWEPMYTLENPWGEKRGLWSLGVGEYQPTAMSWVISADCENIDAALYLMDFMYSDKGYEITNYGIEGETFGRDENGERYILPEFIEAVQSGEMTMQSKLSGADLGFCTIINDWANRATALSPEGVELYEFWMSDDNMYTNVPNPVFTEDENEELTDIKSKLDVIVGDINAFIIGTRPISEWASVVDSLEEAGIERYLEIYNEALARL